MGINNVFNVCNIQEVLSREPADESQSEGIIKKKRTNEGGWNPLIHKLVRRERQTGTGKSNDGEREGGKEERRLLVRKRRA